MHLEALYDTERGENVDRLVVETQNEEFQAEHLFMIGSGVSCRQTARDYTDPLQAPGREYPIVFSAESTNAVFKGLLKIMDGPELGYHGVKPEEAQALHEELSSQLTQSQPAEETA